MSENNLGRFGTELITGFQGIATGYCQYITGCSQYLLVPKSVDGSYKEPQWFDEQRIFFNEGDAIKLDNGATPGCDRAAPKR